MTVNDKLKEIAALFERNGIEDAAREAGELVAEVLHLDRVQFYTRNPEITDDASRTIDSLAERRAQGEPLQYLIGYVEFFGLKIHVGRGVLIPRPETELLVEETMKVVGSLQQAGSNRMNILDLCTGSGCITLALAKHFPQATVYGTDRSEAAMVYATQNAKENGIGNVQFKLGDLFEPVKGMVFDCIVSNPPYVRREEIRTLQREVKDYEPLEALDGGKDGLDFYRRILKDAPRYLKRGGAVLLEIGYDQAEGVREIASRNGLANISFIKDYAGIKRIFAGTSWTSIIKSPCDMI